mmetsp:Transcript_23510/g.60472  ORF Transcript_23510/g.60472 Transcript_23510/m.60472 type:complete len:428 (+) Transcript_23510:278-1561(+)
MSPFIVALAVLLLSQRSLDPRVVDIDTWQRSEHRLHKGRILQQRGVVLLASGRLRLGRAARSLRLGRLALCHRHGDRCLQRFVVVLGVGHCDVAAARCWTSASCSRVWRSGSARGACLVGHRHCDGGLEQRRLVVGVHHVGVATTAAGSGRWRGLGCARCARVSSRRACCCARLRLSLLSLALLLHGHTQRPRELGVHRWVDAKLGERIPRAAAAAAAAARRPVRPPRPRAALQRAQLPPAAQAQAEHDDAGRVLQPPRPDAACRRSALQLGGVQARAQRLRLPALGVPRARAHARRALHEQGLPAQLAPGADGGLDPRLRQRRSDLCRAGLPRAPDAHGLVHRGRARLLPRVCRLPLWRALDGRQPPAQVDQVRLEGGPAVLVPQLARPRRHGPHPRELLLGFLRERQGGARLEPGPSVPRLALRL